ncbi:hypothetical protein G6F50_016292 [Rhizopus delemar]|uniref:Uncharacterized protein n=1 Tax=Rhizopus delemar TaxID=936053 RepID=A0A9P6XU77_9FUNG|nr:hypothetical protein G6F50_016292 [Rhizopus delemar]
MSWPGLTRPSRRAASSASGTLAAEVLAWLSTDAHVGLMRDQPIDVGERHAGFGAGVARRSVQHGHGLLEHSLAVHAQERIARHVAVGHVARGAQDLHLAAVGMQLRSHNARLVGRLQHHGARTVAEQHAGAARARPARMKLSAVVRA